MGVYDKMEGSLESSLLTVAPLSFRTIHCIVVTDSIHSIRPALRSFYVSIDYDSEYYSESNGLVFSLKCV